MTRYHNIDGKHIKFTLEEEKKRDEEEKAFLEKKFENNKDTTKEYQINRKNAYPEIGDQLDMLWHSIDQDPQLKSKYFDFYEAIKSVKVKYPKNG